jgi:hypothetical protein
MGREYAGETFGQISELGVTVVNLPAYRPELKGPVEKFFDLIQSSFKPYLKGCGTIEPDFQERGSHDYRRDARLTLQQFESIMVRCILHYNTQRVVDFPFSSEMLAAGVKPYATALWRYGVSLPDAHLIDVQQERLTMTLLPRCRGRFAREGLKVNRLRYRHCSGNYTERYLAGGDVVVAYSPDDVSFVWLVEDGKFTKFELIEKRFHGCSWDESQKMKDLSKQALKSAEGDNLQARIDLSRQIEAIAGTTQRAETVSIKGIRDTRKREQRRKHKDFVKEAMDPNEK